MEESSSETRLLYNKSRHKLLDKGPNTSKNIGIWTKSELIDDNRGGSKGWRQFSLTDLVWIELLRKLKKNRFDKIVLHAVKNELNKLLHVNTKSIDSPKTDTATEAAKSLLNSLFKKKKKGSIKKTSGNLLITRQLEINPD